MKKYLLLILILALLPQFACATTASTITKDGITWNFSEAVTYGTFANGDYWVVGPVTITSISPASVDNGTGRIINGSQINPSPLNNSQGYDSAMASNGYTAAWNVAYPTISAGNPLTVPTGSSLVSAESHPTPAHTPQLVNAAVLTVLAESPAAGSFRPPYVGTDKTILHNESEMNYAVLGTVAPSASAPALATIAGSFAKLWLDYRGLSLGRMMHPTNNMPDYGRDMATLSGRAALLLNCNYTNEQKRNLLVNYLQWGLDLWGVVGAGFGGWAQDGGQGPGRKFPILFAGKVLNDAGMLAVGQIPWDTLLFGEDQTTIYMTEYEAKRWIGGDGKYPADNAHRDYPDAYYSEGDWTQVNGNETTGIAEYSKSNGAPQQGRWVSKRLDNSYRQCCHANAFPGWILATYIMGLKSDWNHDALFDYVDRYLALEAATADPTWYSFWDYGFTRDMWTTYRANYTGALPTCNDGVKNQNEIGIDCGGSCPNVCTYSMGSFNFR